MAPPLLDAELLQEFETMGGRQPGRKDAEIGEKNNDAADDRNARPETEALWYMSESKV